MKKRFNTITAAALAAVLLFGSTTMATKADDTVAKPEELSIALSPGEYFNKPGKRASSEIVEKANISDGYKKYSDGSLGEYEINRVLCDKIEEYVHALDRNIKVIRWDRKDKSDDLGAAGRKATSTNADIYVSVHTNSDGKNIGKATGFGLYTPKNGQVIRNGKFFCEVKHQTGSEDVARGILSRINVDNAGIPMHGSGLTTNCDRYDEINTAAQEMPALIFEAGFFNNPEDLHKLTNDEYINSLCMEFAKSLVEELNSGRYNSDQTIETADKKVTDKSDESTKEVVETVENTDTNDKNIVEETTDKKVTFTEETAEPNEDEIINGENYNIYIEGREYSVSVDSDKSADEATAEFNDFMNTINEKYNITEGE